MRNVMGKEIEIIEDNFQINEDIKILISNSSTFSFLNEEEENIYTQDDCIK